MILAKDLSKFALRLHERNDPIHCTTQQYTTYTPPVAHAWGQVSNDSLGALLRLIRHLGVVLMWIYRGPYRSPTCSLSLY